MALTEIFIVWARNSLHFSSVRISLYFMKIGVVALRPVLFVHEYDRKCIRAGQSIGTIHRYRSLLIYWPSYGYFDASTDRITPSTVRLLQYQPTAEASWWESRSILFRHSILIDRNVDTYRHWTDSIEWHAKEIYVKGQCIDKLKMKVMTLHIATLPHVSGNYLFYTTCKLNVNTAEHWKPRSIDWVRACCVQKYLYDKFAREIEKLLAWEFWQELNVNKTLIL